MCKPLPNLLARAPAVGASAAIRIAAGALERDAKMFAQRGDRLAMNRVGVAVLRADDDGLKVAIIAPPGRQHRGGERLAVVVAQGEEDRHLALDMRLQPDLLLEENGGDGPIGFGRLRLGVAEIFFDGVAHGSRIAFRLGFGLDAKPGSPAGGLADISHASSRIRRGAGPARLDTPSIILRSRPA